MKSTTNKIKWCILPILDTANGENNVISSGFLHICEKCYCSVTIIKGPAISDL